jgi:hypothetical protein
MKTPEEMAEEYASSITRESERFIRSDVEYAFLAGYKAAQETCKVIVTELKANWTFCCEDKSRLLKELSKAEAATPQWISVKDRLPDFEVLCIWVDVRRIAVNGLGARGVGDCEPWEEGYTHWMPLPELPKEEK